MSTPATENSRVVRIAKSKWSWGTFILVLIGIYIALRIITAIDSIKYALSPPVLPEYQAMQTQYLNSQGWPIKSSEWFHHASQGTATLPIPYTWLVALEAPKTNPWWIFFGEKGPYVGEYMLRLGFIEQQATELNPDSLPIGIAKTDSIYFSGIDRKSSAAGFTCAACHTGQIVHDNTRYIVDGGPAMIDLGLLTKSLGAALGQTALASKFSLFNGRFERFAQKVLGNNYNILTKEKLKQELSNTLGELSKSSDTIEVTEGFSRLDALNRIGNEVFDSAMDRPSNYSPINAPVNFPHIWTTSWFNWVQYDGSIMQPLIRNAGEAIGVQAYLDTTGPDQQRFASSVNVDNLAHIEKWLAGTHPLKNNNKFNGLLAPRWPEKFPQVDAKLAARGSVLYNKLCKGCHLPPIDSPQFWSDKHWQTIKYVENQNDQETADPYLKLKIIPLTKIGTDPAQAQVLGGRTIDTTGLNLNTSVCSPVARDAIPLGTDTAMVKNGEAAAEASDINTSKPPADQIVLGYIPLNDSATSPFGLALGAIVERTNEQWFKQNYVPESQRSVYQGGRPNCLQVGRGYKARPLNGVWATAPFLHNGSLPTIYSLLSTAAERPTFVQLGSQNFDTQHLGIAQNSDVQSLNAEDDPENYKLTPDYANGLFILDTREPGNHNTGHLFDDKSADQGGRIGPRLSHEEKLALIEFLKTI